jgi:hypothetical protein
MADPVVNLLRKAVRGLLFMSEKDAAFKVVTLPDAAEVTVRNIAELIGRPDLPAQEEKFDRLFGELCKDQKWHGEDERALVKRYQNLRQVLHEHLGERKVFKLGTGQVKVYIVGKSAAGRWIALETDALET